MTNITDIEERLSEAIEVCDRYADVVRGDPNNFAYQISLASMEEEVQNLQHLLQETKNERDVEVVELRFLGKQAHDGSLPLHLIGELMTSFSDALHESSYFQKFGRVHKAAPIPSDIISKMDLRLADIAPGSARVFITGKLEADMFGHSLLEDSLTGALDLLMSEDDDGLADAITLVGKGSANKIQSFLNSLARSNLEIEVNWNTPRQEHISWTGKSRDIKRLHTSLKRMEVDTSELSVEGEVEMTSKKGRVEIRSDAGMVYSCAYSPLLYETVRQFRLGDKVTAKIEKNEYYNPATKARKTRYRLLTMRDPEKFKGIEHL